MEIEEITERLVKDIYGLKEKTSRTVVLGEQLKKLSVEVTVEVLNQLCLKANANQPRYQEVLLSFIDIFNVTRILGYGRMSQVYLLSKEKGYDSVTRLLSKPPPKKELKDYEADLVRNPDTESITLGMRKSLARGFNKNILDRLIHDQDPQVIGNLLNNPKTTEREVIKIASKRPVSGEILRIVFKNDKWISRYSIKKALVFNPFTPTDISLGLINFILVQDLRLISQEDSLHPEIISAATDLLERKGG
ncbi:MAG: hypothetical protein JSU92_10915 [Deltaproteobacteria bacterium]|nr:MAG: hypothetical protein JSU92_10915 [Deltaproteobacteria bacterium]